MFSLYTYQVVSVLCSSWIYIAHIMVMGTFGYRSFNYFAYYRFRDVHIKVIVGYSFCFSESSSFDGLIQTVSKSFFLSIALTLCL